MAIKAKKVGASTPASTGDWSDAICDDSTPLNAWVEFVLYSDNGNERHPGPYYPMLAGDSPGEYRFSNDGTDAGAGPWGGTVNVGSVSAVGRSCWIQKRSWARAVLALPQGGIETLVTDIVDIGLARSTGKASDIPTLGVWDDLGAVASSGSSGMDAGALAVLGAFDIGTLISTGSSGDSISVEGVFDIGGLVDTGTAGDVATLGTLWISDLSTLTDTGKGSAASTLGKLLEPPALSSMTAGDGQFTVTVGSVTGATSYDLRHKLTSGSTWTTVTGVGTGTETVTGLTNGSSYDVQARANNADGSGAWSATTTVTPIASGATYYFRDTPALSTNAPSVNESVLLYYHGSGIVNYFWWKWAGVTDSWNYLGQVTDDEGLFTPSEAVPSGATGVILGVSTGSGTQPTSYTATYSLGSALASGTATFHLAFGWQVGVGEEGENFAIVWCETDTRYKSRVTVE